jgi:hypothetical protein
VSRRGSLHLERDREPNANAGQLCSARHRGLLRPHLLFALSVALAALHLRTLLEDGSRSGPERQDRAVRAHRCDLLSVVALRRTAIPRARAGADAPRFGSRPQVRWS